MQKDLRDMDDESMKALANDILAKCQEQELSYGEMRILLTVLLVRLDEAKGRIERAALFQKAEIKPFDTKNERTPSEEQVREFEHYLEGYSAKKERPNHELIFRDSGFLTARKDAIQNRIYVIYNLYGTIRRVLFEGRRVERANALSRLIQQQGENIGGTADPSSQEELEAMKQQLAGIDKLEEAVLFKDDTGKIRWIRMNGERWV